MWQQEREILRSSTSVVKHYNSEYEDHYEVTATDEEGKILMIDFYELYFEINIF